MVDSYMVLGDGVVTGFDAGITVGCNCPLDDVCQLTPYAICRCYDGGDGIWTTDVGAITNKHLLPVHALVIGDTDQSHELVRYKVSELECTQTTSDVDLCDSSPCQNGGACTSGQYSYNCSCVPGYIGINCELDVNECSSNPCQNNAVCDNRANHYVCMCAPGYTGVHCEQEILECASSPCQNGASCVELINSYSCSCDLGFEGSHCDHDINECASSPCQNGGACNDLQGQFSCDCAAGYTGPRCESQINECDSDPCQNGGQCQDLLDDYYCACASGYTGENCETDIDECLTGSPCQNGGTCTDQSGGYACACAAGFTGYNCETDIDNCVNNPCYYGGTCIDGFNSFSCNCAPGFNGVYCQTEINECVSSPCQNNATCVDLQDSYQCRCLAGFSGTNCETDVDDCVSFPCNAGSTCVDMSNGFECRCTSGHGGPTCHNLVVDGNWGPWGTWSNCSVVCGRGVRTRGRLCNDPGQAYGGADCYGDGAEVETCEDYSGSCTDVDGRWSSWGSWSSCSATYGSGERRRTRTCSNPVPQGQGQTCPGDDVKYELCQQHTCGEPLDGGWSAWGPWSACSVTCGLGSNQRNRSCDWPEPKFGGMPCEGDSVMAKPCQITPCQDYSECDSWSDWSDCSATCGSGIETRERSCRIPDSTETTRTECESKYCQTEECPSLECYHCSEVYDGTIDSLLCKGPTKPCDPDQPYCAYVFNKTGDEPGVTKACASADVCTTDLKTKCGKWINRTKDSFTSYGECSVDRLEPSGDTVRLLWEALDDVCSICCQDSRCNRNVLPPRSTVYTGGATGFMNPTQKAIISAVTLVIGVVNHPATPFSFCEPF